MTAHGVPILDAIRDRLIADGDMLLRPTILPDSMPPVHPNCRAQLKRTTSFLGFNVVENAAIAEGRAYVAGAEQPRMVHVDYAGAELRVIHDSVMSEPTVRTRMQEAIIERMAQQMSNAMERLILTGDQASSAFDQLGQAVRDMTATEVADRLHANGGIAAPLELPLGMARLRALYERPPPVTIRRTGRFIVGDVVRFDMEATPEFPSSVRVKVPPAKPPQLNGPQPTRKLRQMR